MTKTALATAGVMLLIVFGIAARPKFFDGGKQIFCAQEAKLCPDGSYVGRTGPNCEFAECPSDNAGEMLRDSIPSDPRNGTYLVEGEWVTLVNGLHERETASGSAPKFFTRYFGNEAMGDVNGDGQEDVVFLLAQDRGGSGTFYYVAAEVSSLGGYTGTNAVFLSDRIASQTTEIRGSDIVVNYAERKPNEPMTTRPSVGFSKYFRVAGDELIPAPSTGTK